MMIARMFGFLLLVVLAAGSIAVLAAPSSPSKAGAATDAYVRRMTAATQAAWPALAEFSEVTRVFADVQLLTSNGQRAWLMNAQGGHEIDMAAIRALGPSYAYKSFDKLRWQGRPAVFVGMGETLPGDEMQRLEDPQAVPGLFSLATHEAFHFYAEEAWAHHPGAERSIRYPAVAEPRLYRNQMIRHLLAAVRGDPDGLARASYWYRRWLGEHAHESTGIRNTDRSEGSAYYVELIAQLLALGLEPGTVEWHVLMLRKLSLSGQTEYLAADHESYALGALAGHLLDRQGVNWLPRVARGEMPASILLGSVSALENPPDESLGRRLEEATAKENRQAAQAFEAFLLRFNDPTGKRLLVPQGAMQGSFGLGNTYRIAALPEKIETGVEARFALSDGRIDLRAATVASQVKEDCGRKDFYWILALSEAEFEETAEGRLRFERDDLQLDIPYPRKSTQDPRSWCVQV
ncbi:hypothetical protein HX870_17220 [Pseudomonas gingeri]|uniref:hypothetical protein n=1 Tax=Pseudomonas gingeri TaxID=117681 RepID=UPI0015A3E3EF|nr:hypothetical protein [Pseudomonas gingeri]NWD69344.1 hypothetical protein [Pseudomonas gingeri]